ncbi:MAG: NusG domain II-containing protein [Oscillospiraceae bacterium]|nr:NusG domain II-containing protein [Oscillospiraceae bacterium]
MKQRIVTLPALIACIALAAVSAAVWAFMQNGAKGAEGVNIYKNGKLVTALPMDSDTEYSVEESSVKVKIENGFAFISESDCKCKTCIGFGKLSKAGQSAVCLPQKVTVELFGESEIDAAL